MTLPTPEVTIFKLNNPKNSQEVQFRLAIWFEIPETSVSSQLQSELITKQIEAFEEVKGKLAELALKYEFVSKEDQGFTTQCQQYVKMIISGDRLVESGALETLKHMKLFGKTSKYYDLTFSPGTLVTQMGAYSKPELQQMLTPTLTPEASPKLGPLPFFPLACKAEKSKEAFDLGALHTPCGPG